MGNINSSYKETEHVLDLGDKGKIKGTQYDDKAVRYAGVPYALPPTGDHRWRKPRRLPADYSYAGEDGAPYDATEFRPPCPQPVFSAIIVGDSGEPQYSEDCLILNIWTPVAKPGEKGGKKWPVYVWLHGGWFQMGTANQEEATNPVEKISTGKLNAIFISVAYRLNVFGFLAGDALAKESGGESAGNFGLWDQRLALEWIQENISGFNGDPTNVTLAGRSAGSYGVHAQLMHDFRLEDNLAADAATAAANASNHPFHRVFCCSNAIPAQPRPLAEAEPQFDELCTYFKIPSGLAGNEKLAKLRQVEYPALVEALGHLKNHTFRPVTDGLFLLPGLSEYQRSRAFADQFLARDFRLLIGEVLNEETLYATYNTPQPDFASLRLEVANYYGETTADRILENYTIPGPDSGAQAWKDLFGRIISDGQVRAPSRALINSLVQNGVPRQRIWRYLIANRLSCIDETVAPISFGVAHAMDKPIWNYSIFHDITPKERDFLDDWIKILVAFVQNDETYEYGTKSIEEIKVATPESTVEIQTDARWDELAKLGEIFAGQA